MQAKGARGVSKTVAAASSSSADSGGGGMALADVGVLGRVGRSRTADVESLSPVSAGVPRDGSIVLTEQALHEASVKLESGMRVASDPLDSLLGPVAHELLCFNRYRVAQDIDPVQLTTGIDTENSYRVFCNGDTTSAAVQLCEENTGCCARVVLGARRPAVIQALAPGHRVRLFQIFKPYTCCCSGKVYAMTPKGGLIGSVVSVPLSLSNLFRVYNHVGAQVLRIECTPTMFWEWNIHRVDPETEEAGPAVGHIRKVWEGHAKFLYTDCDTFDIETSVGLSPSLNCLLLSAVMLIDYMHFERKTKGVKD